MYDNEHISRDYRSVIKCNVQMRGIYFLSVKLEAHISNGVGTEMLK